MEYFIHEDADWAKCHEEWITWCEAWLKSIGLPGSHLSRYTHPKEKLAFYSRGTVDIMFKYPFGVQELWGIAARGSYDLTQHANASGKPQEIFDEMTKKKFVPHVIEPPSASTASCSPCSAPRTRSRTSPTRRATPSSAPCSGSRRGSRR